jgi:hypothetical protein|tara:strand:+ start:1243 stop:1731 length:489 start_codon:yes stop_codon:yes gene_type:complete
MEENKSIREEIREIKGLVETVGTKKKKKKPIKPFKLPFKARINNSKLKKGYLTVVKIEDNMGVEFTKEPIVDGTIKLDGDTFHAVEDFDIFHYKGKPLIFQAKSKLNPYNPLKGEHETYGQKYVMARMEGDKITGKKKMGLGISIGVLIIVGIIVYALFTGG